MDQPLVEPTTPVRPKYRDAVIHAIIGLLALLCIAFVLLWLFDSEEFKISAKEVLQIFVLAPITIGIVVSPVLSASHWWGYFEEKRAFTKAHAEWLAVQAKLAEEEDVVFEKAKHRDADRQAAPFRYKIGRHANVTLAIRYGIANYHYERDGQSFRPTSEQDTILVQKLSAIGPDKFLAKLPEYNNRKVHVIIEKGTEYVKTFYPINEEEWFDRYAKLEEVIKDNKLYSIEELAKLHVTKVF